MSVTSLQVRHEVLIAAPSAAVWRTLTQESSSWWSTVSRRGSRDVVLEAFLGGRVLEGGVLGGRPRPWGTVTALCPAGLLEVSGPMDLPRGVSGALEIDLDESGGGTLMRVAHRASGPWEITRWAMSTSCWRAMAERVREVSEERAA
ncbi:MULTISPECIES: hypothetical protein [unclassified Ornithinimicrobium]|uniref:hypothetical protein n=1 Tax=unclassified Ornithinimicrobium TaxID=2615080 RepID=UPI003852CC79